MTTRRVSRISWSAAGAAALLLSFAAPAPVSAAEAAAGTERFAPTVEIVDAEGLRRVLESLRGQVVILNFWATWCEPCREEFPDLVRFARDHAPEVALVTVCLDDVDDLETSVKPFLREMAPPGRTLIKGRGDPDPFIASVDPSWSGALPATFVHAAGGRRLRAVHGPVDYEALREIVGPLPRRGP